MRPIGCPTSIAAVAPRARAGRRDAAPRDVRQRSLVHARERAKSSRIAGARPSAFGPRTGKPGVSDASSTRRHGSVRSRMSRAPAGSLLSTAIWFGPRTGEPIFAADDRTRRTVAGAAIAREIQGRVVSQFEILSTRPAICRGVCGPRCIQRRIAPTAGNQL